VKGFGGLTIPRLLLRLASVLQHWEFNIVSLEIGSNDLASPRLCDADSLADEILVLADRITNHFLVRCVFIGSIAPCHRTALNSTGLDGMSIQR